MGKSDLPKEIYSVDEIVAILQSKLKDSYRQDRDGQTESDSSTGARPARTVLIIEDSPEIVETVSIAFNIHWPEARIIAADSGNEGVAIAAKENPSAIILDLGLPDIGGIDVLKRLRAFSAAPVIILTVRAEEETIVKPLDAKATDYVIKPFRQKERVARVKAHVDRWIYMEAVPDKEPTTPSSNG